MDEECRPHPVSTGHLAVTPERSRDEQVQRKREFSRGTPTMFDRGSSEPLFIAECVRIFVSLSGMPAYMRDEEEL